MQRLDKTLRNTLEKIVKDARVQAEAAARTAFEQVGVGDCVKPRQLRSNAFTAWP